MKTAKPEVEVSNGITVQEAGRRGGRSTLARRGTSFFREIGSKGGKRQKELYADLLAEFGRQGGRPRCPVLEEGMGEELPEKKGVKRLAPGRSPPA